MLKAILCLLLVVFITPVSTANSEIRVMKSSWCPYVCGSNEHDFPGYITETIQQILSANNYRVRFIELNFARGIQLVEQGDLDLVLSVFREESEFLIYNQVPVTFSRNYFFTLADSSWLYKGPESFDKVLLGAIYGYDYLNDALNQHIYTQQINAVTMVSGERAQERLLKLLHMGRIDTFLDDLVVVSYELNKFDADARLRIAGQTQGPEPVFIGVSPHYPDAEQLVRLIDSGLRQRNTSAVHIDIKNRYQSLINQTHFAYSPNALHPEIQIEPVDLPLISATLAIKE